VWRRRGNVLIARESVARVKQRREGAQQQIKKNDHVNNSDIID
jgi:hypothetical protein